MRLPKKQLEFGALVCSLLFATYGFAQTTMQSPPASTVMPGQTTPGQTMPGQATSTTMSSASDQQKQKAVQDFVMSAADYIKQNGKPAAMTEFNKKDGAFTKGSAYIFAEDYSGVLLADPYGPDRIGKSQMDLQDSDGKYLVRDIIAQAKKGAGWVQYRWPNPDTQQVECKKAYIMPMDNSYVIGSGYYYAPGPDGKCAP